MRTPAEISESLTRGFFGFWVKNFRVSLLLVIIVMILGGTGLIQIPKESTPDIKFGIISVNTLYTGVSPEDIDSLITTEIESELDDVDGIKKIESSSSLGFSNMIITLETGTDTGTVLQDIRDAVDKVNLPTDAEDSIVTEISSENELVYNLSLFSKSDTPLNQLQDRAKKLSKELEGKNNVTSVDILGGDEEEIFIRIPYAKAEALNISPNQIAQAIRGYNTNQPLGNYQIGEREYDFRVNGEIEDFSELFSVPITLPTGGTVLLGEIAEIQREWKDESYRFLGLPQISGTSGVPVVEMTVNKRAGANIFQTAAGTRSLIEDTLATPDFSGYEVRYGQDLAAIIIEDYQGLARNGLLTLVLVFATLLLFVGLKEAFIATFSIFLSFLVTFFVLNLMGLSLNFLTNFSLILTLGIAIDVTIVIIEAASEKLRFGYNRRNAVLLAVRDFRAPLIAGTITTLVVFIPMMTLPDVLGRFLAFIPITVFITLLAALVLALTVNTALFFILSKDKPYYYGRSEDEVHLPEDDIILNHDRADKIRVEVGKEQELGVSIGGMQRFRMRMLHALESAYERVMNLFLPSSTGSTEKSKKGIRIQLLAIFTPIVLLVGTFIMFAPRAGFNLFPSGDSPFMFVTIKGADGDTSESLIKRMKGTGEVLSAVPELDFWNMSVNGSRADITIELTTKEEREKAGLRLSNEVETSVIEDLSFLESQGLTVEILVDTGGPPVGKAVGLKLTAQSTSQLSDLIAASKEFETALVNIEGTKNITNSAAESPGQVIYQVKPDILKNYNVSPAQVYGRIFELLSGSGAGSIKNGDTDIDLTVEYADYANVISPDQILQASLTTTEGPIQLSSVVEATIQNALLTIQREDGQLLVSVEADLESGFNPAQVQSEFVDYAKRYTFPEGLNYFQAGENAENQELLVATGVSFVMAILMIFVILVLLFNSFTQPSIILYSVVLALLGVNIGLFVTGNPYSMPFGIGFIALTGVVVNDAIILIDRFNANKKLGMDPAIAAREAGKSRLQPIILTTLTTVFGVLPLAFEDPFWAGLSFTIVFGLMAGSAMTLFVIPALNNILFDSGILKGTTRIRGFFKKIFALIFVILHFALAGLAYFIVNKVFGSTENTFVLFGIYAATSAGLIILLSLVYGLVFRKS